ncbi:transposase [Marivirga lumbricoides]|uniref:Transposase n=2 Tax=Marivirga lumbricoides TaxID=1046115 RepID=A0ABQ1MTS3_9BACT|nr:transposase [Marivirga lumbricoides]
MSLGEIYFWTCTIKDWKKLLARDKYKQIITDSLKQLVDKGLITLYSFVIMPNHIHLVWRLNKLNGKEMPHASFNKVTAHLIIKDLKENHHKVLPYFQVKEKERQFRIWQRDPLAILMDSKFKVEQKIEYIHLNPLQDKWNLASFPEDYKWSSAKFYETGIDDFNMLTDYRKVF